MLLHYTNHGLDHSKRIISILQKLIKGKPSLLNDHERFILLASAYLHDIGMQFPKLYPDLSDKYSYNEEDLEKIREIHNELSEKAIIESLSGDHTFGLELCKDCVRQIATVSRFHRDNKKNDINELGDDSLAGKIIKLGLLASLLRLADELDTDCRRVNIEILAARNINTESKYHWWAHYYVKSILIENREIKLYFRFPKKYAGTDLINVFEDKIRNSIRSQLQEVYEVLYKNGINININVKIAKIDFVSDSEAEPIPDDLKNYIEENYIKIKNELKTLGRSTGVIWYANGSSYTDDHEFALLLASITKLLQEEKYNEATSVIEQCRTLTISPKDKITISIIAGDCYCILCKLEMASLYYNDALKILDREDLRSIYKDDLFSYKAQVLNNFGILNTTQGYLEMATENYKASIKILDYLGNIIDKAFVIGNIGVVFREKGDLDRSLHCHEASLKILDSIDDKIGIADQLGNIGLVYSDKGCLDKAIEFLNKSLQINKQARNRKGEASCLANIGNVYLEIGDNDKALWYLNESEKVNEKIEFGIGRCNNLGNRVAICIHQEDFDKALEYADESLEIFERMGNQSGKAIVFGNLGVIYKEKKDLNESLKYFKKSLAIHREICNKAEEAGILNNIGLLYMDKKNFQKALDYLKCSLKIYREKGYKLGEADLLSNIGLLYIEQKMFDKSLKEFKEALEIIEICGSRYREAVVLGNIGLVYKDKNELDLALTYLRKSLKYFDLLPEKILVKILTDISIIYLNKTIYDKCFEHLAIAASISCSNKQSNHVLFGIMNAIKKLKNDEKWDELSKINCIDPINIVLDSIWLNLFKAIYEYSMYKNKSDDYYKKRYESSYQSLPPILKDFLVSAFADNPQ